MELRSEPVISDVGVVLLPTLAVVSGLEAAVE